MNHPEIQSSLNFNQKENNEVAEIKKIVFKILNNWYWFVISVFVTGVLAFAFNRYTVPVYEINTTMLFEASYGSTSPLVSRSGEVGDVFQGLGQVGSMKNISNQMAFFNSTSVVAKTLDELDFEVSYHNVGRVRTQEAYNSVPFRVIWDKDHPQLIDLDFNLTIQPDGKLEISANGEQTSVYSYSEEKILRKISEFSFSKTIDPGTRLVSREFSFIILLNENFQPQDINNYKFRFHSKDALIKKYQETVKVILPDENSTLFQIWIVDYNVNKGIDFLNKLTEVYMLDNLSKKNENANRTIQFINSQLENVSDSLNISQNRLQLFQSTNRVVDLSVQSEQLLSQMTELEKERVAMETQNKYYYYLKNYIESNQELETVIAPSAMGIADPLLNSLILKLNELITQKSSQTSIRKDSQHPTILRLNAQIESVKNSLLENTTNILIQSDVALSDLNNRIRNFEAQVKRLPATERNFVNIERGYQLNNEIYTFLLQKLSEAQIAKASNVADSQVIEEARYAGQVKPQPTRSYAIALMLGLAFPAIVIYLLTFFNNKIVSEEEITSITDFPVIGHVFHNVKENASTTLVLDKPNSPASEPYRSIRNKLIMITKGKDKPVIAVTSTFPKEGKSYNTINIASSYALMRKKTVILDLDLRNSRMIEAFDLKTEMGVVNYIIGKAAVDDIICDTKHPLLKLIPAGPIPPNPAEMLADDKMQELIEKLRNDFDVVVIDTPPVGYVADMFQLNEIIDANLFIVRHKYTFKQGLKTALKEVSTHHLKGVGIIVNDIKIGKNNYGFSGVYGYGYGYGYDYGSGTEKGKNYSKRKKLFKEEVI